MKIQVASEVFYPDDFQTIKIIPELVKREGAHFGGAGGAHGVWKLAV